MKSDERQAAKQIGACLPGSSAGQALFPHCGGRGSSAVLTADITLGKASLVYLVGFRDFKSFNVLPFKIK